MPHVRESALAHGPYLGPIGPVLGLGVLGSLCLVVAVQVDSHGSLAAARPGSNIGRHTVQHSLRTSNQRLAREPRHSLRVMERERFCIGNTVILHPCGNQI